MATLIIDNYDSFTFNLASLVAVATGEAPLVIRNDEMAWDEIRKLNFTNIILSPGPGHPERRRDFGVSLEVIRQAAVPILGVCLGNQGIAYAFGGKVVRTIPVHGQSSEIIHDEDELFRGIPVSFSAVRYHSLAVIEPLPAELRKIAWTADGIVMALRHISRPLWGVQFHPESICTEYGSELVRNFLAFGNSSGGRQPARAARRRFSQEPAVTLKAAVREAPLRHTPETLFRALFSAEPFAFWLDSAMANERNRFSYMGSSPETYTSRQGESVFDWLAASLRQTRIETPAVPFPFTGGYIGYLGYELKAECGGLNKHRSALPDSILLRVERFLAIDHRENKIYMVCAGEGAEAWLAKMEQRIAGIDCQIDCHIGGHISAKASNQSKPAERFLISRPEYLDRIRECLAFIDEGESYEICLTNKVLLETNISALDYYEGLRRSNPAPYAAYLKLADIEVASSSPECFLRIDRDGRAESRPIKGTIRRGQDAGEDTLLRDRLARDPRFRAENLMIVDLVRNDLARVCVPGSVHVPCLMKVETYETLHQLVSTISGQIAPEITAVDCLRALFPGGSMTGAPKLRTMELLDGLETEARGIYSGAIGYVGFNGTVDLSIVIRTAVFHEGKVSLGAGGAIVAQSDPAAEWDEIELKAQALVRAFGTGSG